MGGRLTGFARSLTDGVYSALIQDVVVEESTRGRGVGKALIRVLLHELRDVTGISLGCEEGLVPFYESLGWERDDCAVMIFDTESD